LPQLKFNQLGFYADVLTEKDHTNALMWVERRRLICGNVVISRCS